MEVSFNSIYLPIKMGITDQILKLEYKKDNVIKRSVTVTYHPDKPIGKWVVRVCFIYNAQFKALQYGKTRKEIKTLVRDIADFQNDPHLFLNQ